MVASLQACADSITHTFALQDFIDVAAKEPSVDALLRFPEISKKATYKQELLPELKRQDLNLTPSIAKAIAQIVSPVGLTHKPPIGQLCAIVSDIARGWGVKIRPRTLRDGQRISSVFAFALYSGDPALIDLDRLQSSRLAFLEGCAWGLGDENANLNPELVRLTPYRARLVGLECPVKILMDEVDTARTTLLSFLKQ